MKNLIKLSPLILSLVAVAAYLLTKNPKLNNDSDSIQDNSNNIKAPIPKIQVNAESNKSRFSGGYERIKLPTGREVKIPATSERIYKADITIENNKQPKVNLIIETEGKAYSVPLKTTQVIVKDKLKLKPRINLGISSGVDKELAPTVIPNLSISLVNNNQWALGTVGVGYDVVNRNPTLLFSPVYKALPVLTNTSIGLDVGADVSGNWSVGVGIKIRM